MRKISLFTLCAVVCGISGNGYAGYETAFEEKNIEPVGRVEKIYVRVDGDVYVEQSAVRREPSQELWADVQFVEKTATGHEMEFVRLPEITKVRAGDIVEAKVFEYNELDPSPIMPENHVTKLVAKRNSFMAMAFDLKLQAKSNRRYTSCVESSISQVIFRPGPCFYTGLVAS